MLLGHGFRSGVYLRNVAGAWVQEVKLVPNDGVAGEHFGQSVAIDMSTGAAASDAFGYSPVVSPQVDNSE